jgi:sugar phosphate isomerase/epimerase
MSLQTDKFNQYFNKMNIRFFCPMWGLAGTNIAEMLQKIKDAGYDGIEFGFPLNDSQKDEFIHCKNALSLDIIGQQYGAEGGSFPAYKRSFSAHLYFLASFNPLFINSQTGRDFYSFEQNAMLIREAEQIEMETGIPVIHETHRGKFPFCVVAAAEYAKAFPRIRFTADFSHFSTVSESFLQDQKTNLRAVMRKSVHIHARVGHPQGPQITDPRLPEWKEALNHHIKWWDAITGYQRSIGAETFTITPEFGPEPYMFSIPGTKTPVADQWDINRYMMELLRKRYNKTIAI